MLGKWLGSGKSTQALFLGLNFLYLTYFKFSCCIGAWERLADFRININMGTRNDMLVNRRIWHHLQQSCAETADVFQTPLDQLETGWSYNYTSEITALTSWLFRFKSLE